MSSIVRGLFHHRVVSPAEANSDAEATAYLCLEEARLRVEWLDSCRPREAGQAVESELRTCHRELGLAGFNCCAELRSGSRLQWLALAHDRLRTDERDPVKAALDAIVRATDAVEHALIATDLAEHVQAAHSQVMAACEAFGAYLRIGAGE